MRKKLLLVALLAGSAANANAAVITFEGVPNTIYDSPILRSGFLFGNVAGDEQHFHEIDSTGFPGFVVSNGTGVLLNDRDTRIQVTRSGGGLFTLGSFNAAATASDDPSTGATILRVRAFIGGVQSATADFAINGTSYGNFLGTSLGSFDRLVFDGINGGGGFAFDNITLNDAAAIPEPATWAMMLAGFGLAGSAIRRRRLRLTFA